ncbi:heavy metal-associated domain-containing protein [Tenacibaculum sp.]|nr:heavy metal-associated domain-containing protein [Tenacibaculum sp.]
MKGTINIQNLKCRGCEKTIIDELLKLENITKVSVNQVYGSVYFEYKISDDLENVKNKLSKLGYPAHGESNNTVKKAISYVSCAIGRIKQ